MTAEDVDPPELQELAEAARRRQRRWMATILGTTVGGGVLLGLVLSLVLHRHAAHHHSATVPIVLGLVAVLLVLAAEVAVGYWLLKSGRGMFKAPLALGLPFRDRRVVLKAVRRGEPPPQPLLRTVGQRMAERILRYRKQTFALYGVIALSQVVNALLPDRPSLLRGVSAAAAVLLLLAMAYQRVIIAGARRYLERLRLAGG